MKRIFGKLKPYLFILFVSITLLVPEVMFRHFLGEGAFTEQYVSVVSVLFAVGWIAFFLVLCVFILPRVIGKTLFAIITIFYFLFAVSECVYYKIFEQFFRLKSIHLAGEGLDYFGYAIKLVEPWMIACLIVFAVSVTAALLVWCAPKERKRWQYFLIFAPVIILSATHIWMQPELHGDSAEWDVWRKPRMVYKNFTDVNKCLEISGVYQFCYLDLYTSVFPKGHNLSTDDRSMADEYFSLKGEANKNRYSGVLEGKNVIAVMLESIDTWMIDEETTPTLHKMMQNGINFTNYNSPFFGVGFTLSSEFAFNTGFFTPVSAGSASKFSQNTFPYALANLFKEAGYTTNSFHFNSPEFYTRGLMHKGFGYEKYNSAEDFGITGIEAELDSNLIKNDEFYKKMTEKKPFFNFFVTYSAHLPYQGDSGKLNLAKEYRADLVGREEPEEKNNAKILAADTDEFFRILLERLEEDGLLDDTVIVAYTDHFAYGVSSDEQIKEWKGDTITYCVPAFIYSKDLKAREISKPMMTIDWAPTLVNLFGLSADARYLGTDVLDDKSEGFAYFETGAWMDETMHYNPKDESSQSGDALYIQKQTQRMKNIIQINDIVVLGDYYRKK